MHQREFLLAAELEARTLDAWIEAGWLLPGRNGDGGRFSEVDLARARLIRALRELGVNDDGVPIVLDLIDQLHGLRRTLRDLLTAIGTQPEAARRKILSGVRGRHSKRHGT